MNKIDVTITSYPDRPGLVAELWISPRGRAIAVVTILLAAAVASPAAAQRQMEYLGRGVVAVHERAGEVFVSGPDEANARPIIPDAIDLLRSIR